jgi:hypothetical protein
MDVSVRFLAQSVHGTRRIVIRVCVFVYITLPVKLGGQKYQGRKNTPVVVETIGNRTH